MAVAIAAKLVVPVESTWMVSVPVPALPVKLTTGVAEVPLVSNWIFVPSQEEFGLVASIFSEPPSVVVTVLDE